MARRIEVEIVGDSKHLERAFKRAGDAGHKLGNVLRSAAKVGAVGLAAGLVGVAIAARSAWKELEQAQVAGAQTEAVIKATGQAAHVSAEHVKELSDELLRKTGIDDEVIQQGENTLLTFTKIRNETGKGNQIFDRATKVLLDMSVALKGAGFEGSSLKSQALKLGKALNDPVKGITALSRVGIVFTDSQKKMIKGMVESGHTMDAQRFILSELEGRIGGSAEAFGKTLPGQMTIFRERLKNVGADLLSFFIPALTKAMDFVGSFADVLGDIAAAPTISVAVDIAISGLKSIGARIKTSVESAVRGTDWRSVGMQIGQSLGAFIVFGTDSLNKMLNSMFAWLNSHAQQIAEFGAELAVRVMLTLTDPVFWSHHLTLLLILMTTVFSVGLGRVAATALRAFAAPIRAGFSRLGVEAGTLFLTAIAKLPPRMAAVVLEGVVLAGRGLRLLADQFGRVFKEMKDELERLPMLIARAFEFAAVAVFFRLLLGAIDKAMGAISSLFGIAGKIPGSVGRPFRSVQRDIDNARERLRHMKEDLSGLPRKKDIEVNVKLKFQVPGDMQGRVSPDQQDRQRGLGEGLLGMITSGATSRTQQISWTLMAPPIGKGTGGGGLVPGIRDELAIGQSMGLTLTSGRRAPGKTSTGGWSLHGSGRAIDMAGPPSAMAAFARTVAGRPGVVEVIYSPLGGWYPGSGWVGIGGKLRSDHFSHVHVGVSGDGAVGMGSGALIGGPSDRPPTKKQREAARKAAEAAAARRSRSRSAVAARATRRTTASERKQEVKGRASARRQRRRERTVEDLSTDAGVAAAKAEIDAQIRDILAMIRLKQREKAAVLRSANEARRKGFRGLENQYRQQAQDIQSDILDLQEDIADLRAEKAKIKKEEPEGEGVPTEPGAPEEPSPDLQAQLAQAQARLSVAERALQLQTAALGAGVFPGVAGGSGGATPTVVFQSLIPDADQMRRAAAAVTEGFGMQGFVGSSRVSTGL